MLRISIWIAAGLSALVFIIDLELSKREEQFRSQFVARGVNGQILNAMPNLPRNFESYDVTKVFAVLEASPSFLQQMKESGYTCFASQEAAPPSRFVTCKAKAKLGGKGPHSLIVTAWFNQDNHLSRAEAKYGFQ